MVAPVEVMADDDTPEITGGPVALLTVTVKLLVAVSPPASVATAARVWEPLAAVEVFQEIEYAGPGPVTMLPRLRPSSLNCTPAMATLSVAFAETVIVPETVAPLV